MASSKPDRSIVEIVKMYHKVICDSGIEIERLYLFGSHARGAAGPDSDIDVAVFFKRPNINRHEEDVRLMRLRRGVDLSIEPHAFSIVDLSKPDPFVSEILAKGVMVAG